MTDPAVERVNAELTFDISRLISDGGLTIDEAAGAAGMEPDALHGIVEGRTGGISIERLDRIYEAVEALGNGREP